jgi:hypothetical protein
VLKLLLCQGWLLDAFPHEPKMRLILNIRSPKPFLRSWRHRYVEGATAEFVFGQNLLTLERILDHFGRSDAGIRSFSEANLLKSELWRWRFVNEPLYRAFSGHERFAMMTYERFETDPPGVSQDLFAFAGLDMDDAVNRRTGQLTNSLFRVKAPPYRHEHLLDEAVSDVLSDSPLLALWAEQGRGRG